MMMALTFWIMSGILAGWMTGMIVHASSIGTGGDFLFGLIGGLVGGFFGSLIGLQMSLVQVQIVSAALGGAGAVWFVHLLAPKRINV